MCFTHELIISLTSNMWTRRIWTATIVFVDPPNGSIQVDSSLCLGTNVKKLQKEKMYVFFVILLAEAF